MRIASIAETGHMYHASAVTIESPAIRPLRCARAPLCLARQDVRPGTLSTAPQLGTTPSYDDLSEQTKAFVSVYENVLALQNVRVIDGTGAPAHEAQTIVLRNGIIKQVGNTATTTIPTDAVIRDMTGKTITPGFVMVHEHMFYPSGNANYNQHGYSFPRLYLAGGATTIRTAGSMAAYADLNIKRAINVGTI
ncbi:MAG: hypothetical protein MJE77_18830 [Proteobacteria bacterium]|nr:hypothetical protein [Pseudomonadota bacterium]